MASNNPKTALGEYIKAVRKVHGKGTPENTYLPLLKELLDGLLADYEVITHPAKGEQGLPDFALREKGGAENVALGEAEALDTPLHKNAHGLQQAQGYARQAPTLLTNFYEFVVLDGDTELGRYSIPHADLTGNAAPATLVAAHLEPLSALLNVWASARGSLRRPQKIAELLAYYARQALNNLEGQQADALAPLRKAMEDALGTSFSVPRIEKGKRSAEQQRREEVKWAEKQAELDHFFRSSLVQALFYGLFAGWVTAARLGKGHAVTRENIADDLHIPVISLLLDEVNTPRKLTRLDLRAPVDRAVDVLRRVDAEAFLKPFQEGEAVTYFYEPFLDAFDRQLKKDLGIWYTPHEIIRYQIGQVHGLLQTHLNRPLGLLDPDVTVLDPATGTGGYLLELGRFLAAELHKQGKGRVGARLKEAFQTRIFGFELLPAPFAIAHLQLALLLAEQGAPLQGDERVNVYLTNSLNGWNPRTDKPDPLYDELGHEQELTDEVKHGRKIMVMIGNPPYARFADMPDNPEEQALIAPYKACLRESWGVKKQLLDDLYIRFIRLAEWRVAENGQQGIVSFVTNRSYLTGISHPVMRQHLLRRFDHLYIDDLHGNQRAHRAGDGSVFTTETSGGIRVGVAVGTFVKLPGSSPDTLAQVHYRDYQGSGQSKRQALLEQAKEYEPAFTPDRKHRYILKPVRGEDAYWDWPSLEEMFPVQFIGVHTGKDEAVTAFSRVELTETFNAYYDLKLSDTDFAQRYVRLMTPANEYSSPGDVRTSLVKQGFLDRSTPYQYRPFDVRWIWYEEETKLIQRKNLAFKKQVYGGNKFLYSTQTMRRGYSPPYTGRSLSDLHLFDPDAVAIPLKARYKEFDADKEYRQLPNIADFHDELARAGVLKVAAPKAGSSCEPMPRPAAVLAHYGAVKDERGQPTALAWELAEQVFYHALAVLSAPAYRAEHAEYLAEDWPRVPMSPSREVLRQSAALGRRVAALLDPQAQPEVPGTVGRLVAAGTDTEAPESSLSIGPKPRYAEAREVYVLSDVLELKDVPKRVWDFTLGGYPVLKNWVEYRRGRTLTLDDADWLEGIVRRVSALLDLGPELDMVYSAAKVQGPE